MSFIPLTVQAMVESVAPFAPTGCGEALAPVLDLGGVNSRLRLIYLLANIKTECLFKVREENLDYTAVRIHEVWPSRFKTEADAAPFAHDPERLANAVYGGRMGNTNPGDGWAFRGRGWPQLTGRDAYTIVGGAVGKNLVADPDQLLTVEGSAAAAVGFFAWKKIGPLADADDMAGVRRRWNGGDNGLADFSRCVATLKSGWAA